jgi:cobalamin synthase
MVPLHFLLMVVFGALIALKITDNTTMSWWVVLSPLWAVIMFDLCVLVSRHSHESFGHIGAYFTRRRRMREILELPVEPATRSASSDSANWWLR